MSLSNLKNYYYDDFALRIGKSFEHLSFIPHIGTFEDSVLVRGATGVDYRYFPKGNNTVEFYICRGFDGPIYIYNTGSESLLVKVPNGDFTVHPGSELCRVQ